MVEERLESGRIVAGRFTLARSLGGGTHGEVWAAADRVSGSEVAIKILRPEHRDRPEVRERFHREALLLGSLSHPSIPRLIVAELDGNEPHIALELARGRPLAEVIAEHVDR